MVKGRSSRIGLLSLKTLYMVNGNIQLFPPPQIVIKPHLFTQHIEKRNRIRNLFPHLREEGGAAKSPGEDDAVFSRMQQAGKVFGVGVLQRNGRAEYGDLDVQAG